MIENKKQCTCRIVLFCTMLLVFLPGGTAQTTFNRHDHLGMAFIQNGGALPVDDGYLLVSQVIDTTDFTYSWMLSKVDLQGNLVCNHIYSHPGHIQRFTFSDIIPFSDTSYVTIGSDNLCNILTVVFDKNCDTLFTKKYHPEHPEDTISEIRISRLTRTSNNGIAVIANISVKGLPQQGGVFKFDRDLNLQWYDFYKDELGAAFLQILMSNTGRILVFGNIGYISPCEFEHTSRIVRLEYTLDGFNTVTRISDPEIIRKVSYGVTEIPDGSGFITSACLAKRVPCGFPGTYLLTYSNSVQKLDHELKVVWDTKVGHIDWSPHVRYTDQTIATDESGIVAAGNAYVFKSDTVAYQVGVISKVRWNGDSLWSRYFVADAQLEANHYIIDIEPTTDHGYFITGWVNFREGWDPLTDQHLWLIKTDEYGCVVPGCHLSSSVPLEQRVASEVFLYPNPASNYLYVYLALKTTNPKATIKVVDLTGHSLYTMPLISSEATYMIDTSTWPAGQYFCQIHDSGKVVAARSFVVTR